MTHYEEQPGVLWYLLPSAFEQESHLNSPRRYWTLRRACLSSEFSSDP